MLYEGHTSFYWQSSNLLSRPFKIFWPHYVDFTSAFDTTLIRLEMTERWPEHIAQVVLPAESSAQNPPWDRVNKSSKKICWLFNSTIIRFIIGNPRQSMSIDYYFQFSASAYSLNIEYYSTFFSHSSSYGMGGTFTKQQLIHTTTLVRFHKKIALHI